MDSFSRDGLVFFVRDGGPRDGQPIVLLHGFPQDGSAWDAVTPLLHAEGFRTLVPDQRGYSPAARPRGRQSYRVDELVADVVALADQAGAASVHLVGHDWGGIVGWALAAAHPARVRSLSVLSTPHPAAYARSLPTSTQALRSAYVGLFQLPWLPERLLLAGGGAVLRRLLVGSGLPAEAAGRYVEHMRQPGALTGALAYYRALLRVPSEAFAPVRVPTLYVWSTRDATLGRAAAERTAAFVEGRYRFEVLDGVSHWIPEERPDTVALLVVEQARSATRTGS